MNKNYKTYRIRKTTYFGNATKLMQIASRQLFNGNFIVPRQLMLTKYLGQNNSEGKEIATRKSQFNNSVGILCQHFRKEGC